MVCLCRNLIMMSKRSGSILLINKSGKRVHLACESMRRYFACMVFLNPESLDSLL